MTKFELHFHLLLLPVSPSGKENINAGNPVDKVLTNTFLNTINNLILKQFSNILPSVSTLWTPTYFQYPQVAKNVYNPTSFNQYFFDWLTKDNNLRYGFRTKYDNLPNIPIYSNDSRYEIEGSNTGGADDSLNLLFLYLAKGSGVSVTPNNLLVSLNKLHSVYIGNLIKNNTEVPKIGLEKTFEQLDSYVDSKTNDKIGWSGNGGIFEIFNNACISDVGFIRLPFNLLGWGGANTGDATSWDLTPIPPSFFTKDINTLSELDTIISSTTLWGGLNLLYGNIVLELIGPKPHFSSIEKLNKYRTKYKAYLLMLPLIGTLPSITFKNGQL